MDYNKLIEETTNKINNYSFDDKLYDGIYSKAKERLDGSYIEGIKSVNAEYKAARRKAVGDNALATKSLQQELATRGLARSGESAMLAINQSLALRNTVADIARAAIKSRAELVSGYNKELTALEKEQAALTASAAEKDKAALNDRLSHLESLQADKEKWQADYSLELLKENNRVQEKKDEIARQEAERDQAAANVKPPEGSGFPEITPTTTPLKTAESIMYSCGVFEDDKINTYRSQDKIRRELTRITCTMGLSPEYIKDVLHVLVLHGFESTDFDINTATGKTLKWINATYENTYNEEYNRLIAEKKGINEAHSGADKLAKTKMYEFIDSLNLSKREEELISEHIWM